MHCPDSDSDSEKAAYLKTLEDRLTQYDEQLLRMKSKLDDLFTSVHAQQDRARRPPAPPPPTKYRQPTVYHKNARFTLGPDGDEYVLAMIGPGMFSLINTATANRWNDEPMRGTQMGPTPDGHPHTVVLQQELQRVCGSRFVLVAE